ncbi:TPA: hypothetical protein IB053_002408 [Escherichia coli]|nr:hypothetical protein [Escherichia coli]
MARIRTIKPEFWTDEDLSEVSEAACLLAIGLLNYADDEGYFNANPKLIKATVFPIREQSGSITVLMHELSSVGYISLFSGHDGKIYGLVNNFAKHQVINKAKKSAIKDLCAVPYQYGSDTELLPPGKERKGKEQGKENPLSTRVENPSVDNFSQPSETPDPAANNFVMDNRPPSAGGIGAFGKFVLTPDWKPDPDILKQAALWGVSLDSEITQQELAQFVSYWVAEGKAYHHTQWQQKLVQSVKTVRTKSARPERRDIMAMSEPDTEIPPGFRG